MCCLCNGVCHHVGPHSYCSRHGSSTYQPSLVPPSNTNFVPLMTLSQSDVERIAAATVDLLKRRKERRRRAKSERKPVQGRQEEE